MSYEEDKLIDEFAGWECPSTPHHQFITNQRSNPVKAHKNDSSDATVRQSTPLQPQTRQLVVPEDTKSKESLYNALQAVAVALAAAEDSQDPASSALRVLHEFCDGASEISQESSRRRRSSLGIDSECNDIDTDTAELLELMQRSGNINTHNTSNSRYIPACSNSPLIPHPLKSALDNLEVRRYTLDPNWRFNDNRETVAATRDGGTMVKYGFSGAQQPHEILHEVDLPMLPPQLGQASTTPLKEKDAFNKSTPPLPVRGDSARQLYLKTRPSTQKLAERFNRIHTHEPSKSQLSPAFGHPVSLNDDGNSPEDHHYSSDVYVNISGHRISTKGSRLQSTSRPTRELRCAAVKSKSVFNYNPISKRLVAQATEMSADRIAGTTKESEYQQLVHVAANTQTTESLIRSKDKNVPSGRNKERMSAAMEVDQDLIESFDQTVAESVLPDPSLDVENIDISIQNSKMKPDPPSKDVQVRGRGVGKNKSSSRSRHVPSKDPSKERKKSSEKKSVSKPKAIPQEKIDVVDKTKHGEGAQMVSPWQTPRPTLGICPEAETSLAEVRIGSQEETENSLAIIEQPTSYVVPEIELQPIQDHPIPPERQSFGIQVTTGKSRRKVNRQKKGNPSAPSNSSKAPAKARLRRISICDVENPDFDPSAAQALEGGKIVRQRSKRIRIAPLAWWAGEHIEYQSFDGSIVNATATAVYKVENQDPDRSNVKNKKSLSDSVANNKNAPQSSVNKPGSTDYRAQQAQQPSSPANNNAEVKIDTSGCFNSSKSLKWMKDIDLHKSRVMQAVSVSKDEIERAVAVRLKEGEWLPVSQNGYNYSVRLLLQTLRNTTVGFQLGPNSSKGQDQTRATQMLLLCLISEDKSVVVETCKVDQTEKKQEIISIGEWIAIPPQSFYTVTNKSRIKSCTIIAHVVACDNELFKAFLGSRQS